MSCKVELIPITEGNRITVKEEEKVLIGRGSSLGVCQKTHSPFHSQIFSADFSVTIRRSRVNMLNYS